MAATLPSEDEERRLAQCSEEHDLGLGDVQRTDAGMLGAAAPSWDLGSSWTADLPHELACSSWTADLCSAADGDQGQYVDLVDNPEQYTGYSSDAGASRVWEEWHAHNSFLPADDGSCASAAGAAAPADLSRMPVEMRLFHRLTSGIHASVSSHIAANYLLDRKSNTWGQIGRAHV